MIGQDCGLAPERSWLSWQRTEISALALTALLMRLGLERHDPIEVAAAIVMGAVAVLLWTTRQARRRVGTTLAGPFLLRCVSAAVVLAATLLGMALVGATLDDVRNLDAVADGMAGKS